MKKEKIELTRAAKLKLALDNLRRAENSIKKFNAYMMDIEGWGMDDSGLRICKRDAEKLARKEGLLP